MKALVISIIAISLAGCSLKPKGPIPKIEISAEKLESHVFALVNTPKARNWLNDETLIQVSKYIQKEFLEIGLQVEYQNFTALTKSYRNVIGTLNPEKKKIVVIGAHYDVHGEMPGADDNASGVSGLIELARILKKHEKNLEYQIQFVAYANEEPPFFGGVNMGSYIHAQSLYDKQMDVSFMISLEMIGYFSEKKKSQEYPLGLLKLFYPTRGNFIAVVSKFGNGKYRKAMRNSINWYSDIKCRSLAAPSFLTGIDFSDHRNYWEFGYKAIMITDTAFYRNKHYHTFEDLIEYLDFEKMKEVVKGIALHFIMQG